MKNSLFLMVVLTLLLVSVNGIAEEKGNNGFGRTDKDVQGTSCVRDTKDMRLNHMKYILHQRKETTRLGKRWPKTSHKNNYSLELCVNCHARVKKGNEIVPVSINSKDHFCNQCHRKVAVKIDCFQCHNSKPTGKVNIVSSPASKSTTTKKDANSKTSAKAVEK